MNGFTFGGLIKSIGTWVLLTAVVATLVAGTGCADNRISLSEFVRQEQNKSMQINEMGEGQSDGALEPGEPIYVDENLPDSSALSTSQLWATKARAPYRLGPGDVIQVSLLGLNETGQPVITRLRVDKNGNIRLPIAGELNVTDMEIDDLEQAIVRKYVPSVVTSLTAHAEMRESTLTDVVVVGAAVRPGIISLRRSERDLLHAVASAGGLTSAASGTVKLQRIKEPDKSVRLNLLDPVQLATSLSISPLEPGDIVTIEAAPSNTVFVGGLVMMPGPKTFAPGVSVTLMQALASAGGPREEVAPTEATLTRRRPDGTDVQVKVDLNKLKTGEEPNVMLAAGDILWVPETMGTKTLDFINKNFFLRFGATASYNVVGNATGIEFLNRREMQSSGFSNGGTNSSTLQNSIDPLGFLAAPAAGP